MKNSNKLRVFEAFSGIGAQRKALERLGINHEVVAISEIDKFAIKSYEAVHGKTLNLGDISKLKVEDIPDHDLFTYSFPCTDISGAGLQKGFDEGSGTRSSLLWECKKVIEGKKPKYLLMENVKALVSKKFKPTFDKWCEWLEEQGYTNYWQVLNAKDYGVPQNRERVFMISILGVHESYIFPEKQELHIRLKDVLDKEVDKKYYLKEEHIKRLLERINIDKLLDTNAEIQKVGNVLPNNKSQSGITISENGICRTLSANEMRGAKIVQIGNVSPNNHGGGNVYSDEGISRTILARDCHDPMKIVTSERLFGIFDKDDKKHQAGSVWDKEQLAPTLDTMQGGWRQPAILESADGIYLNMSKRFQSGSLKDLSRTLKAEKHDAGAIINSDNLIIRKLTPKECWRLMGFDDSDFEKAEQVNSNTQLYKQAGNSIVVNCLEGIFYELLKNTEYMEVESEIVA